MDKWPSVRPDIAASFAAQGLMTGLGARLLEARDGRCLIEAGFHDALGQQHGFFHGGAVAAIADTSAGFAALSVAPPGSDVLTVEFKISFVRPASGEFVRARAEILKAGRNLATASCRVLARRGNDEVHCAELLATLSIRSADARPG